MCAKGKEDTMVPETYQVDAGGHITIGGMRIEDLAAKFGTPLYVFDYQTLVNRLTMFQTAVTQSPVPGMVAYAAKAFFTVPMGRLIQSLGLGLDVVSGGELFTALAAGVDPQRIMFHGNVKTPEEIAWGLDRGVGYWVVDSLDELDQLDQAAGERHQEAAVVLRLTPGIDAHTHAFIRTGHFDSKFGFAMAEGISDQAVEQVLNARHLRLAGFHAHIGSQILETEPFLANAEALLRYSRSWYDQKGWWPEVLDIGGGFGVRYQPDDDPPNPAAIIQTVQSLLAEWTPATQRPPRLIVEPGRSVVAEAGVTIYTVRARKTTPGGHGYVAVDGGMGDNIRPALYQAVYQAEIDGKVHSDRRIPVSLVGRYCESGDVLIPEAHLPAADVGDRVVVFGTGAYNYAMASTYNRVPRPAVVVVREGQPTVWVRRETWQDLITLDNP